MLRLLQRPDFKSGIQSRNCVEKKQASVEHDDDLQRTSMERRICVKPRKTHKEYVLPRIGSKDPNSARTAPICMQTQGDMHGKHMHSNSSQKKNSEIAGKVASLFFFCTCTLGLGFALGAECPPSWPCHAACDLRSLSQSLRVASV
jgi:hypothetical protein